VVVGSYPLLSLAPTPVEVELGCDNDYKYRLCSHTHMGGGWNYSKCE
jgi:predicted MPP superfamily phosphohydrolase